MCSNVASELHWFLFTNETTHLFDAHSNNGVEKILVIYLQKKICPLTHNTLTTHQTTIMSLEVYGAKGNTLLALTNNLKLSIALAAFEPKVELTLNEVESNLSLKDKKSGFELIEPNAIVKYLAKDFTTTEAIKFEEQVLYSAIKSNKR